MLIRLSPCQAQGDNVLGGGDGVDVIRPALCQAELDEAFLFLLRELRSDQRERWFTITSRQTKSPSSGSG